MCLSNQLGSPRTLVCPADRHRLPASSFRTLTAKKISYFYNPDATESNPLDIMLGDDNLTVRGVRVKSGLLILTNMVPFRWTADRHSGNGNLGLADGSVQGANSSSLNLYLSNNTNTLPATNGFCLRLAIP
jgi:prepilin-type processing-associated H-X9-DG protein